MNGAKKHYYLYNNVQYDNMKDCRESIGDGIPSKAFKHMLRMGIVKKVIIDVNTDTNSNSQEYEKNEKTPENQF